VVRIVQETGVGEITIEEHGTRVSVRRTPETQLVAALPGTSTESPAESTPRPADGLVRVESPMVGTFYRSPQPGSPSFVEEVDAVAVYSTADDGALHVRLADHAVCVGPPPAGESYLRIPSIVAAATTTGCQAVHPGYGFLAENPAFVEACADNDLVFVGPPARVMTQMGDKIAARRAMRGADVP